MDNLTGILDNKGTPLEKQKFTWKEMAGKPISKLDDDAFTRVRIMFGPSHCVSVRRKIQAAGSTQIPVSS